MRTYTHGYDTLRIFDEAIWKQERNIAYFEHIGIDRPDLKMWTDLHGEYASPLAVYTLDNNGRVVVDFTDYLRAYPEVTHIYFECTLGYHFSVSVEVVGLINPQNAIVPPLQLTQEAATNNYFDGWNAIGLPSVTLPSPFAGVQPVFEFYPTAEQLGRDYWNMFDDTIKRTQTFQQLYAHTHLRTYDEGILDADVQSCRILPLLCGHRYAAVRWVSFTGVTRVSIFEVRDLTQTADEVIKLETLDGTYNQIKGRTDGFKLYLDELDAYDYWYYSDIITSSKVEVSLDGQTWNQVEVTTKSVTIPNTSEGKTNKLEITVNWRNYDAATM